MAVAVEVGQAQVRISPVDHWQRPERGERAPAAVVGALGEARVGTAEVDQVELTVTGQIQQLLAAAERPG